MLFDMVGQIFTGHEKDTTMNQNKVNDLPVTEQEEELFNTLANTVPLTYERGITATTVHPSGLTANFTGSISTGELTMDTTLGQVRGVKQRIESLFDAIKHGDEAHQNWLKEAIAAHFGGHALPEYVPSAKDTAMAKVKELFRLWWFENIEDAHFFNEMVRVMPMTSVELSAEPLPEKLSPDPVTLKQCDQCCSERHGDNYCHKCGHELFMPPKGSDYPYTPDVSRIRLLAKEVGYALGEHGTGERDLDLVAVPWTEQAVSAEELVEYIAKGINGRVVDFSHKPLGRYAANIQIDGWFKLIDISVARREGK